MQFTFSRSNNLNLRNNCLASHALKVYICICFFIEFKSNNRNRVVNIRVAVNEKSSTQNLTNMIFTSWKYFPIIYKLLTLIKTTAAHLVPITVNKTSLNSFAVNMFCNFSSLLHNQQNSNLASCLSLLPLCCPSLPNCMPENAAKAISLTDFLPKDSNKTRNRCAMWCKNDFCPKFACTFVKY